MITGLNLPEKPWRVHPWLCRLFAHRHNPPPAVAQPYLMETKNGLLLSGWTRRCFSRRNKSLVWEHLVLFLEPEFHPASCCKERFPSASTQKSRVCSCVPVLFADLAFPSVYFSWHLLALNNFINEVLKIKSFKGSWEQRGAIGQEITAQIQRL